MNDDRAARIGWDSIDSVGSVGEGAGLVPTEGGEVPSAIAQGARCRSSSDGAGVTALLDERAQALADELVVRSICDGRLSVVSPAVQQFLPSHGLKTVARLAPRLPGLVFKLGEDPAILDEARLLDELAADASLPLVLRRAFPAVYASGSRGPLCAYVMEDLSATHEQFATRLLRCVTSQDAAALVDAVWGLLGPVYAGTRTSGRPDLRRLYIERSRTALGEVARLDSRFAATRPIVVRRAGREIVLGCWVDLLERAGRVTDGWSADFASWAHGDLNTCNILVARSGVGDVRLLDPIPGFDDAIYDVGRLISAVRYAHVLSGGVPLAPPELQCDGNATIVVDDIPPTRRRCARQRKRSPATRCD